jgi:hypothetical protein
LIEPSSTLIAVTTTPVPPVPPLLVSAYRRFTLAPAMLATPFAMARPTPTAGATGVVGAVTSQRSLGAVGSVMSSA